MVAVQARHTVNWLRCAVGDASVGIDLAQVVGVERGEQLAAAPTETEPGRLVVRGAGVPVFPLAWWFSGGPTVPRAGGQVILVATPRGRFGLLVDRVAPVARVSAGEVVPPPPGLGAAAARLLHGVVLSGHGPVGLLNVDALDPAHEPGPPPPARPAPRPEVRRSGGTGGVDRLLTFARTEVPGPNGRAVALGLPVGAVDEVCDVPVGSPVAAADEHVRELIAVRGRPLALADAARWVGLPGAAATRRVVVVRAGEHAIAVSAGSGVQVVPAALPSVPLRHRLSLRTDRLLGAFDTTDLTILVPRWTDLLDGE
ncbi:CheW-like domain protein [Gemmata obscuriglobus]|uniref:CheW-like domain-containing protein n=1 Tax=Gemmata obscuriglobus TaxID=114 RepID=A0A2Z3GN72_9BACT|nr:chemotaxis protein CheW [Gemmata obscuriglobus]AWM35659.1 hypothetical protein C1280_00565 [Gemmata obscuriglobus]QEG31813.1 CheW-like domain protein [Gemmata obscuriglobus]VTS11158.1 hypothetical protein : CheW protein OS=Desulfobulbus propionicus (strain ATCC 33891 / DSM 2032 / 1pr3) GN=Despr_2278 PE=4 SV=1: CheW: CheW [Gemmata obscuriglobus UQM 2246]